MSLPRNPMKILDETDNKQQKFSYIDKARIFNVKYGLIANKFNILNAQKSFKLFITPLNCNIDLHGSILTTLPNPGIKEFGVITQLNMQT